VEVEKLDEGLWWWTGRVGGDELGSLYVETARAITLVDPVVPPEDSDRFLRALDRDVARHGGPVEIVLTRQMSVEELVARYAATLRADGSDDVLLLGGGLAWIPAHRTLFAGADTGARIVRARA
jgi:hypothetical protein